LRFILQPKMDATSLITPSDTHQSVKRTHLFMIANAVVILIALFGTVGWLFIAAHKKWYPYKPYTRNTGPPGTQKMTDYKGSSS
jgi:hypothetical protein